MKGWIEDYIEASTKAIRRRKRGTNEAIDCIRDMITWGAAKRVADFGEGYESRGVHPYDQTELHFRFLNWTKPNYLTNLIMYWVFKKFNWNDVIAIIII